MLLSSLLWAGCAAAESPLVPTPKKGRGDVCVEATDVMRRNHMEFILHQRDDTVHRGIRSSKHSFVGCIDCHRVQKTDGQLARFDEPQHFCSGCHAYAAVKIDCFECHADRPAQDKSSAARRLHHPSNSIVQTTWSLAEQADDRSLPSTVRADAP